MLNEQEKNALLHFLSVLNDNKIKSLANSITHGRIQSKTREDAITCILLHSESLISVLNNKKVSSACLLNYLHQLKAPSPGNASKDTLLQYIYSLWKFPPPNTIQNNPPNIQMSAGFSVAPQASPIPSINQNNMSATMNSAMNSFSNMSNPTLNNQPAVNVPTNVQPFGYTPQNQNNFNQFNSQSVQPAPSLPFTSGQAPALQYPGQNVMNQQYPVQPTNAVQTYNQPPKNPTSQYSQAIASYQLLKEVNSLAFDEFMVNFAKMFYELLNNASGEYMHGLNRSHFFDECKMIIEIKGGEEDIEQVGESVADVLKLLSDLKREHQLAFNPNLTPEGVRGKTDSHGLIYAVASGTLHQGRGQLVGVYEQSFILRKDPFEQNSCKIADSTLILRSSSSVNSFSQLLLPPSSKKSNERNLAIGSAPCNQLQITNFSS